MNKTDLKKSQPRQQPRIGITMRFEEKGDFYLRREYSEAIAAGGGIPFHLPLIPQREFVESAVAELDGILLPGSNSDVDPLRYGEQPHRQLGFVQPLRDETDSLLIAAAEKMKMPILGICYGMQALNVARGGTLVQDIETQIVNSHAHQQIGARERRSHQIVFEPNTLLGNLCPNNKIAVNSFHHQAIATIGENLKIAARATDKVIEAIEDVRPDYFVFGVQWHPELDWKNDEFSQTLFKAFLKAAEGFKLRIS